MGHRTPHSGHVVCLEDAQASGSVHVGEIDEHKARCDALCLRGML
jgi:hypothetical protein